MRRPWRADGSALGRAALELAADDLERQVLVALHAEHAHQPAEVVLGVEPVAGLGAPRRDEPLLLEVAELAHADVGELGAQPLDDRADGEELLVADVEQEFGALGRSPPGRSAPRRSEEGQLVLADLDLVAVGEHGAVAAPAIDVGAVEAALVDDHPRVALAHDDGVVA